MCAQRLVLKLQSLLFAALFILLLLAVPSMAEGDRIKLVAFGDSLVAGYGLAPNEAFPAQLSRALAARGYDVDVINSGVSGDTTAGGLARFDWAIPADADAVLLELGANDALRGLPVAAAKKNLDQIMLRLKKRGNPVLLAGMLAPANWGPEYKTTFDEIYPKLAAKYDAVLYPFFLDGVALDSALNQRDGIHPNAKGVAVIVEKIMPAVVKLLDRAGAKPLQTKPQKTNSEQSKS